MSDTRRTLARTALAAPALLLAGALLPSAAHLGSSVAAERPTAASRAAVDLAQTVRRTYAASVRASAFSGADYSTMLTVTELATAPSPVAQRVVVTATVQGATWHGDRGELLASARRVDGTGTPFLLRPGRYRSDFRHGRVSTFTWVGRLPPSGSGYDVSVVAGAVGRDREHNARFAVRRVATVLDVTTPSQAG